MANAKHETRHMKPAPTPGGNFVKLAVGGKCAGTMEDARMEEVKRKDKKGRETVRERYFFTIKLDADTTFIVGKKKAEKEKVFKAGDSVTLPDHGFLVVTMRRTACEIKGVPFSSEEDTDLKPLVGRFFEITRLEDGVISQGEWAGKNSALYDVQYDAVAA